MPTTTQARIVSGELGDISVAMEVHDCPSCGFIYAATKVFFERRRADGVTWTIPCGHTATYRESEADKAKKKADELQRMLNEQVASRERYQEWLRAERESHKQTERRLAASKGQQTKLKKRIAHGVCPCCNRTFAELERHMKRQHPEFVAIADGLMPDPETQP